MLQRHSQIIKVLAFRRGVAQVFTQRNRNALDGKALKWGISEPYFNPADGKRGIFGVNAWVELGGEYYFELDCRTGEFLWGKEVRL
ncbi:hypothetical protein R6254_11710 [Polaromonas sp. SM01]|nr:hypothetical protein [Polaromonas sp. SM01]